MRKIFFPIVLIIPALLSVPTAIETRFMLPLFLYAYMIVAFLPEYKAAYKNLPRFKKIYILIMYVSYLMLSFVLSNTTYSNVEIMQQPAGKIEKL
jgi:hypothetical protein